MKKKMMIAIAISVLSVCSNIEAMRTPAEQNADIGFVKVPFESLKAPFRSVLMPIYPVMDAESRARVMEIPDASMGVEKRKAPDFISKPIAEWPVSNALSKKEKAEYDNTWSAEKTLEENQRDLVKTFIDTCCDFSFKTIGDSSKRILLGKTDSGEKIAIQTDAPERDDIISLPVQASAVRLSCTKLYSFDDDLREQIKGYFTTLSESPIGCKLMRIAIAKFRAYEKNKLIFIPTDNDSRLFYFSKSKYLGHVAKEVYPEHRQIIDTLINNTHYAVAATDRRTGWRWLEMRLLPKKSDFIILPHDETKWHFSFDLIRYDESKGTFNVERGEFPIETILFHEFLHAIHDIDGAYPVEIHRVIEERCRNFKEITVPFPYSFELSVSVCAEDIRKIWKDWHTNDEEYVTMYGLGISGFNPLNESMYLSHRYGFIRGRHSEATLWFPNFKDVNGRLAKSLIEHGDVDLHRAYLDPEYEGYIGHMCPRFGVGQYQCSDLDPKTGEKLALKAEEKTESKTVTVPAPKKSRLEKKEKDKDE